ncbi:ABC transporter substrate-binding protein [Conexibacter arvalis]|uniref:Iron complex transport system substrate-binding protein n=1 Tax=Conexibacter arvalis TaxID=912552 RepID=A0A840IGY5_9ACTN|nr:ABC transporter substrate-binding protein [Conexibacter arvalis]MBB4663595.1 iron complex transport system substrate-binding protein [Conexibacter arvalis]
MTRRPLRALAALLAAVLLVGLSASAAQAQSRIVALTPFTANALAGLGVKPVGIGQQLGGHNKLVKGLKGVKTLTLSHPLGPNLEHLALLNPQLVLSSPTWRKGTQGMKELGIRVVEIEPTRVNDVPRQTEFIGSLVGRRAKAKKLADQQRRHIRVAKKAAKRRPTVLLVLGVGRKPYAFLPSSWGGDLVKAAGGRLLTQGLKGSGGFAQISDEIVVKRNPDVIIAVPHGTPGNIPQITDYLRNNPAWKNTKAARNNRIYVSTDNTMLQAWTSAARSIYDVQTKYLKNR